MPTAPRLRTFVPAIAHRESGVDPSAPATRNAARSALSVVDQAVCSVSSFATTLILAHAMLPPVLGSYVLVFTAAAMLGGLQQSLVTGPLRVLGAPRAFEACYVASQARLQVLILGVESLLLTGFLVFYIRADTGVVLAAIALLVSTQSQEFVRTVLATRLMMARLLAVDLGTNGLKLVLLGLASVHGSLSVAGALAVVSLSSLGALALVERRWLRAGTAAAWSANWRFGRWLLVESVAYYLSTRIYIYIVAAVLGDSDVAVLSATQNIANSVNVLAMGISAASMPIATLKLRREGYGAWRSWLVRVSIWMAAVTGIALLLLVAFGNTLMHAIYPGYYAGFGILLALLAFGTWLDALSANLTTVFWTAERPELNVVGKVLAAGFTLACMFPVVHAFGVYGAALGSIATPLIWVLSGATILWLGKVAPHRAQTRHA